MKEAIRLKLFEAGDSASILVKSTTVLVNFYQFPNSIPRPQPTTPFMPIIWCRGVVKQTPSSKVNNPSWWTETHELSVCDASATRLCNQGGSGGSLVAPGWGQNANGLVVTGETVDTGLNKNQAELGVLVLAVALKVLADSDSLQSTADISKSIEVGGA